MKTYKNSPSIFILFFMGKNRKLPEHELRKLNHVI
uniref:Uncharacterized protein n=1 Tax=Anguilla anguilla TaxID=7936 RepID=A0A0E9W173_ANGAN